MQDFVGVILFFFASFVPLAIAFLMFLTMVFFPCAGMGHNASQGLREVSMWLGIVNIHNYVFVSRGCTDFLLFSHSVLLIFYDAGNTVRI